jgi:hypothetical protein
MSKKSFDNQFLLEVPGAAEINSIALKGQPQAADFEKHEACSAHLPSAVIQYECGDCYVEALGINFLSKRFYKDRVKLLALDIITKTYHDGRVIDKELSHKITTISREHFCMIEFYTRELNPCTPLNIGVSPIVLKIGCINCLIKVMNVRTVTRSAAPGLSLLLPPSNQMLYIKTFNRGKIIGVRSAKYAYVQTSRMCSREENVIEPEPLWGCGCASCECGYGCDCEREGGECDCKG